MRNLRSSKYLLLQQFLVFVHSQDLTLDPDIPRLLLSKSEEFQIQCEAKNIPENLRRKAPQFYKDSEMIDHDMGYDLLMSARTSNSGAVVRMVKITKQPMEDIDQGTYTCRLGNHEVSIHVQLLNVDAENAKLDRNTDKSTLSCIPRGVLQTDVVEVKWFRDNITLTNGSKFEIDQRRYTLNIMTPETDDSGIYICEISVTVFNSSLNVVESSQVFLYDAPRVTFRKQKTTLYEGDTVSLSCLISGYPLPTLRWFKDDKELNTSIRHDRIEFYEFGPSQIGELIIRDANKTDSGQYTCEVSSTQFSDNSQAQSSVVVQARPSSNSQVLCGQLWSAVLLLWMMIKLLSYGHSR